MAQILHTHTIVPYQESLNLKRACFSLRDLFISIHPALLRQTLLQKYMSMHAYPEYSAHKKEHDSLAQKLASLYEGFKRGEPVLTVGSDKKYGQFLNRKGLF